MVDKCDSVCFEIEARMDPFAGVLTTLSHSRMYELFVASPEKITLMCDEYIYLGKLLI
jgi:hypothetical protein